MPSHTQKNSLLCPNCGKLVSRTSTVCPYCNISNPGSWWKNSFFAGALFGEEQLIRTIITANIGMFILSLLIAPGLAGLGFSPFSFLSPSNKSLFVLGSTGSIPLFELHRWWSLIAANYLHGSLMHILFNMIALYQLGPLVLREYGRSRMIAIYTIGGVAGYLLSALAGVHFTIGASAAVCSLIGAMLYYGKSRGGTYGQNIFRQIGGWAISLAVFGFFFPGINNWGHGGGIAAGALLGYLLGYREKKRESAGQKTLATICIGATLLTLLWACISALVVLFLL